MGKRSPGRDRKGNSGRPERFNGSVTGDRRGISPCSQRCSLPSRILARREFPRRDFSSRSPSSRDVLPSFDCPSPPPHTEFHPKIERRNAERDFGRPVSPHPRGSPRRIIRGPSPPRGRQSPRRPNDLGPPRWSQERPIPEIDRGRPRHRSRSPFRRGEIHPQLTRRSPPRRVRPRDEEDVRHRRLSPRHEANTWAQGRIEHPEFRERRGRSPGSPPQRRLEERPMQIHSWDGPRRGHSPRRSPQREMNSARPGKEDSFHPERREAVRWMEPSWENPRFREDREQNYIGAREGPPPTIRTFHREKDLRRSPMRHEEHERRHIPPRRTPPRKHSPPRKGFEDDRRRLSPPGRIRNFERSPSSRNEGRDFRIRQVETPPAPVFFDPPRSLPQTWRESRSSPVFFDRARSRSPLLPPPNARESMIMRNRSPVPLARSPRRHNEEAAIRSRNGPGLRDAVQRGIPRESTRKEKGHMTSELRTSRLSRRSASPDPSMKNLIRESDFIRKQRNFLEPDRRKRFDDLLAVREQLNYRSHEKDSDYMFIQNIEERQDEMARLRAVQEMELREREIRFRAEIDKRRETLHDFAAGRMGPSMPMQKPMNVLPLPVPPVAHRPFLSGSGLPLLNPPFPGLTVPQNLRKPY